MRWKKPSTDELRSKLTPLQFDVTQHDDTERPFANEFWNNHATGLYVDVATGEPLFCSRDKFDSGSGWPSFTQPIQADAVIEKQDVSLSRSRIEVRSTHGDSHLGHVFNDGPAPTEMRYCINSAALRFVPKENMAQEGYADFLPLMD